MSLPKRILYLIESLNPCGAEHALVRLVTALDRREWEPIVWTIRPGRMDLATELARHDVPVVDCSDLKWNYRSRVQIPGLVFGALRLRRARPHIVHSFSIASYGSESLAARLVGAPYIVRKASERFEGIPQTWSWKLATAKRVVVLTQRMRDHVLNQFPSLQLESKVRLIPNGVDTTIFRPGQKMGQLRKSLGIGEQSTVIVSVGRLSARKNHSLLVKAVARCQTSLPSADIQLVLVGRGGPESEEANIRSLAAQLNIAARVHLLGSREDIPEILQQGDIFSLSGVSNSEGMSNALLEAMSSGLPAVVTKCGTEEVIDHRTDGLVVECDREEQLCAAIHELVNAPALRGELGRRGREKIERLYSIQKTVDRNIQMYRECLN